MAETKTKGTKFGPEPWQFDPYDGMTREEIDHEVDRFLESQKTVPVSLRLPRWVIEQAKSEANRRGIPYQRLLRALIEVGLRPGARRRYRPPTLTISHPELDRRLRTRSRPARS